MTQLGPLNHTAKLRPLTTQYKSKFTKSNIINNSPSFLGDYVWSKDGTIFHSFYAGGDDENYQYRLEGNTWVAHNWDGYSYIDGKDVWKANGNYYHSCRRNKQYYHHKLNGNRWETFNPGVNFEGRYVWEYNNNTFLSINGNTYQFIYGETFASTIVNTGAEDGRYVWSDGENVYCSGNQILNTKITPSKFETYDGFNYSSLHPIISYGGKVFVYTNTTLAAGIAAVLVGTKFLPFNFYPTDDVGVLHLDNFWSDGINVYYSYHNERLNINLDYMLEPASTIDFEHELPATENTVTVNLYMNNSEKNVIGKSLTSVRNLNGTFKQEADMVNLSIQVDLSTVPNFNYLRVPLFNRYYFVDNIVNIRDDLWEISCHVDVLESFKDTIMSTYGLIERNEFEFNPKIIDHLRVIEQGVTTEVLTSGMTLETVLNAGVPQTMTETSPRFMLVGTFMSLEGEIT